MIKPNFLRMSTFLVFLLMNANSFAEHFGKIAQGLEKTAHHSADILHILCVLFGIGLITTALIRIKERRANPNEISWGSILALLAFGLALIAITFIPMTR